MKIDEEATKAKPPISASDMLEESTTVVLEYAYDEEDDIEEYSKVYNSDRDEDIIKLEDLEIKDGSEIDTVDAIYDITELQPSKSIDDNVEGSAIIEIDEINVKNKSETKDASANHVKSEYSAVKDSESFSNSQTNSFSSLLLLLSCILPVLSKRLQAQNY